MRHQGVVILAIAAILFQTAGEFARCQDTMPRIIDSIAVGGTGGWDYAICDAMTRRLYVSHAKCVEVVNIDKKLVEGTITNTPGVHGIAIVSDLGVGFTSNGSDATVTVFDLATLALMRTIRVTGQKPDAIIYEPVTHRIFTFNGGSGNSTAIDPATLTVVGTLDLGGAPEFAVADGNGKVFVNLEDKNQVVCFDAATLSIESRWPIAPCATPTGLSMDRKNRRLFVGGRNQLLAVLNADDGTVIDTFPIGEGVDATTFDPEKNLVYASNKDGSLDIIVEESADEFTPLGRVATVKGAKTMALDTKTHRVYLPAARAGRDKEGSKGEMYILVVGE